MLLPVVVSEVCRFCNKMSGLGCFEVLDRKCTVLYLTFWRVKRGRMEMYCGQCVFNVRGLMPFINIESLNMMPQGNMVNVVYSPTVIMSIDDTQF
jgi:hypothetical protein